MKHFSTKFFLVLLFNLFCFIGFSQSLMIANFEDDGTDLMCNKRFITIPDGNPFDIVDNPFQSGNNSSDKVLKIAPVYMYGGFRLNLSANISASDPRITDGKTYDALRFKYRVNDPATFPGLSAGVRINGQEAFAVNGRWTDKGEDWKTVVFIFTSFPSSSMTYIEIDPYKALWTESGVAIQGLEVFIDDVELVRFEPVEKLMIANFENDNTDLMCPERIGPVGSGSTLTLVDNPFKTGNNQSDKVLKISDVVMFGGFHLNLTRNIVNEADKILNGIEYTGFRFKYRVNNPSQFSARNAGINPNGMNDYTVAGVWSDTDADWQTVTFTFDNLPANMANIQIQPYKQTWTGAGVPIAGLEIYMDDLELFKMEDFSEGLLNMITVDGKELEFFEPEITTYSYNLPYTYTSQGIPAVEFEPANSNQTVTEISATNLSGTVLERTTTLIISENAEEVARYDIIFNILPELDVYICLGQSNMSGYGEITDDDKGVIDNTFLLTPGVNFEPAENPLNRYSTISNGTFAKIGPAYGFAKSLIGKTANPVGLLVNARNGSAIDWWRKGNTSYNLYAHTLERAKEARKWGEIKGILWHQGESDSWQANAYMGLLQTWVNNFRADLGDINNEICFVAGELAHWRHDGQGNNRSTAFNEMIRTISTSIPNSNWVSAEGLTPWKDDTDPHFDRESAITLGERYAEKIINKYYSSTSLNNVEINNSFSNYVFMFDGLQLTVKNIEGFDAALSVYDVYGKKISRVYLSGEITVKLPAKGIYILILSDKDGVTTKKIICQ